MHGDVKNIEKAPKKKYHISKKVDLFFIDINSVSNFIARFFREAFFSHFGMNKFGKVIKIYLQFFVDLFAKYSDRYKKMNVILEELKRK
jgi:hypothetical protein